MIRYVLGLFGYYRIPRAAVELSMAQEDIFRKLIKVIDVDGNGNAILGKYLEGQRSLIRFLRSGRL